MANVAPGSVIQYRKGSDVLLARAAAWKGDKLQAIGEDGRPVELARDRVLQVAGEILGAPTDQEVRAKLREVRAAAEAHIAEVDLKLLWDLVRDDRGGASIESLVEVYHGRSGSPAERLAFGFALCQDRVYFRQKGDAFVPRMESEVIAALERREAERLAAERRKALLAWMRAGLERSAMAGPPPADSAAEIAAIEDLAVRGDEAPHAPRAKALMKELQESAPPGAPRFHPTPDGAFDLLVRLGIFTEHENLALRRTGIPAAFAPHLLALASDTPPWRFDPAADPTRRDLRHLEVVTIDDIETEDRDDALSLEPLEGGGYRLGVHIADVAAFIAPGSPLDEEALRRGTTVYLPRGKLEMFPAILSESRMSLDADGDRPVLSFFFRVSPDLDVVPEEIALGCVRVARNLHYEEVDAALADPEGVGPLAWLARIEAITERLARARAAKGSLQLQTPDLKIRVDSENRVHVKRIEARSRSREMVAELMILANVTAALHCRERGIPAVYRRQDAPGEPLPAREAAPAPEVWAFEVRRRLQRTELGPTPGAHYSLALDCYLQVTSPIRRYQDLVMQRQLEASIKGEPLPYSTEDIVRIAGAAEAAAGESNAVERETTTYWLLRYLESRRGTPEPAVVLMERDGKALVELVETGVRAFVRQRGGKPKVGERVSVKVDGVHARRGEINVSLA